MKTRPAKHFLLASDFDQTLSFNDSGSELSELLGITNFEQKVAGLSASHLVQQGGELAYLIRHDPEFRGVRREHLVEAGRRVRLKKGLPAFVEILEQGVDGNQFSFYVVSAAPREVVVSALDGIVPADHIFGTDLDYDPHTGEVRSINRVRAGFGKVAVLDELGDRLGISPDRVIYVGDGSSDIHVMLHVNNGDGFTIAVSENRQLARIAQSTVLSDNASSVLVPVLDQVLGLRTTEIRALLESTGLVLDDWQRDRTDRVLIREWAPLATAS
ncbi:MAG TPA: HAD family hydrolase [Steroidobacteraceae bacterium]|jgi:phosphoserine phosphatase|nr:HAD family hydrolase [Steroidobacteraceae bacterium]